jgi:ABC-type lipoprotein export system ATPase subunit
MMEEVIRLDNVVKMHGSGIRAINSVSFSVFKGENVMISGSPGSGKTTLARLIAGVDRPSTGQIFVLGKSLNEMGKDMAAAFRNKYIGIMQRDPVFLDNLSVLENVALPLMLHGEVTVQRNRKAKEQLKTLGLQYAGHAHPSQLTLLERHKAAIARVLITQPKILLLDDFAADLAETEEIKRTLHALCCYDSYTVVEITGAVQCLICADRTIKLDPRKDTGGEP